MSTLTALLSTNVRRFALETGTLEDALSCLETASNLGRTTGSRAVLAGLSSDRVAYAVLGGYDAAVRRLLGPRPLGRASFCVTEEHDGIASGHPRSIETVLERGTRAGPRVGASHVTGTKSFATLATHADRWVVIASEGNDAQGRNRLCAVIVERGASGVTVVPRPPLPFAPEIPHAMLELDHAPVAEVLDGDGYERYVKPFRTIEDAHVSLAIAAYAFGEARIQGWDATALVAPMESLLRIADEADASSASTHLDLDDALRAAKGALDALPWERAPALVAERWLRDRRILDVASKARAKRTEKARSQSQRD